MFNDIQTNSAQRISEIRELLAFITPLIPKAPSAIPRHLNTIKGLIFVQLYGVIEYTISTTIAKSILYINAESLKLSEVKPILLGMALNPDFESLIHTTYRKWNKRFDLLSKIEHDLIVNIATDILPTDGRNIHAPQLESIWKTFCLTDPIFNDISFQGRLQDIVTNRIAIAHGNDSASDIGSRFTEADISVRINDVSSYCSYFISVFEDYIVMKKYKK